MQVLTLEQIRERIDDAAMIECMRDALIAQARGECDTPMPMHLDLAGGEAHMKASYRRGSKHFVLKMATTIRGVGNGMMLVASAETGEPVAYLADSGHLADVRTAAVAALVAKALGRRDQTIGILGTGIQARLTVRFHARVLPLKRIYLWGRNAERAAACADEIRKYVADVVVLGSASAVAAATRLMVTCTASRSPLLMMTDIEDGTHITAVGADSAGKQELDGEILRASDLLLVDSVAQCERLGELQHALEVRERAVELGRFLESGGAERVGLSVADLTGLGVEDLFAAESVLRDRAHA